MRTAMVAAALALLIVLADGSVWGEHGGGGGRCGGGRGRYSRHEHGYGRGSEPYRNKSPIIWHPGKENKPIPARQRWGVYVDPLSQEVLEAQKERDDNFRRSVAEWRARQPVTPRKLEEPAIIE